MDFGETLGTVYWGLALQWWILIIVAILVAIAAGVGGYIYYRNQNR